MGKRLNYRLTKRAEAHLVEIASYGLDRWGEEQALHYIESLYKRFQWLADNPETGTKRDDIKEGYRSWFHIRHLIFYRLRDEHIEVLAVLHHSRDVVTYLT